MNNIDLDIHDMEMYAEKFKRSYYDKPKFIIVGTPTCDSSEFEKVFQSARDEGCEIGIFKLLSFIDDCYPIEQLNSTMQEQLCDVLYEEQKLLKELPKKKKHFKKILDM